MEKTCPRSKEHPPSQVNFCKHSYEKNSRPFAQANSTNACSDCLALTSLTQLGNPRCLYRETLAQLEG